MTTYYLSGPMRGKPDYNYPVFNAVQKALFDSLAEVEGCSFEILNPASNFDGDSTRSVYEYMQVDFEQVLKADVIVLLPGWESSEGATREVQIATWTGKRFMTADPIGSGRYGWAFTEADMANRDNSPREAALTEATQLITGDRNNQYGPPTQDFQRTADMANGFGFQVNGSPLQGHHVAVFQILLKMSRLAWTPAKRDSWVDTAGYAGCGYECAVEEAKA
jgi:hypothetical protein